MPKDLMAEVLAETEGRDRWAREQISQHGKPNAAALGQLDAEVERHSQPWRAGPHELASAIAPTADRRIERGDESETAGAG